VRRRITGRQIAVALVVVVVTLGWWVQQRTETRFERAKDKAIDYLAMQVRADPNWLNLVGYMHRRFGLESLASGRPAADLDAKVGRPEVVEVYRRIEDPRAVADERQIAALPTAIDRITASALHCDRITLPRDWMALLRGGSAAGGYALTQSVLATEWSVENGCVPRVEIQGLRAEQIAWLVNFIQRREELRDEFDAITDIWLEAVAMLYYIGAADNVRPEWLEEIVRIQNEDGGWSRSPAEQRSDPHATALALWVLLEHLRPDVPRSPWIQQVG
jgi:hypothetical protein